MIFHLFILFNLFVHCNGMVEGLYCGEDNCYDLLGVTRDSSKSDISKSYRVLAKKWHPDKHKTKKEEASVMFRKIATAYETLKDEDSRKDYDYMLDNPEEFYSHYLRYYQRRMAPKVDVRVVIVVTITVISAIQYLSALNNYKTAIDYLATVPKYRIQALHVGKEEGLFDTKKKKDKFKSKEELKEEEENILKSIIRNKLDIRGSYSPPSFYDILWLQLLFSPYYLGCYLVWLAKWIFKYNICQHEYTDEAKQYLIRKNMKLSELKWEEIDNHEKKEFMEKELWIKDNYVAWQKLKELEMKEQLAENSRYKQYRRYIKKGGPGQMTFGPD